MAKPIASRVLAACELLTLTALLASLASFAPRRHSPGGDHLLPAADLASRRARLLARLGIPG